MNDSYNELFEQCWLSYHEYDDEKASINSYEKRICRDFWEHGFIDARNIVKDEIGNLHNVVEKLDKKLYG